VKRNLEGVKLDNERVRISDKALESLKGLSKDRPLLVVLEDLHWADESSLFVLEYIARNIGVEKILLLGTFRPDESALFGNALEVMKEEGSVEELALEKLGGDAVARLADETYPDHALPAVLIKNLTVQCEGNPLFVKEMLWQMGEEGSIVSDGEKYVLVDEDYSIPDSVQEVVGKRLERLDTGAMALAEYVSCIGTEFDDDLALSCGYGKDVPAALVTLKGHGIVLAKGDVMQFSHAIYQDFIYTSISARWKSAYHKNLGEYYENAYGSNPDAVMYELARHFSRSNEHPKSLEYCIKAGEKAEGTYAPEQAVDYYELALASLSKQPHDQEEEADLLAKLGEVKTLLASFEDAVENLEMAYETSKNEEFITRMMNKIAFIHLRQGDEEKASELLDRCLEIAEKGDIKIQIAQAHHSFGILNIKIVNYSKALEHLEKSLDIKKDMDATELLSDTYHTLGMLFSRTDELDKALNNYQEAVKYADQVGDKQKLANALGNIGIMKWYEGDMDAALDNFLRTLEIRKTIGDKSGTGISYDNIAGVYGIQGDLEKSIEYYERGIEIFRQTGERIFLANLLSNVSLYYMQNNNLDKALERAEESLGLMLVTGNKRGAVHAMVNMVNIHEKLDNSDKALELADTAMNIAEEIGLDREKGLVYTALGAVYRTINEYDKSKAEFEKALELFGEFEDKLSESILHYEYALLLTDISAPEKAKEHREKALAMFEEMGMKLWVKKCREALEGL
jgi:tetratricopeptide (TPR) repeat protein